MLHDRKIALGTSNIWELEVRADGRDDDLNPAEAVIFELPSTGKGQKEIDAKLLFLFINGIRELLVGATEVQ